MHKLRILLLAMLALFAISAVATTVAQAEVELSTPELLVDGKESKKFNTASGLAVLESASGEKIEATSSTGKGELTSATAGTLEVKFKESNIVVGGFKFKCLSPGAAAGEIIAPLDYNLVFDTKPLKSTDKEPLTLGAGIILKLLNQIHFECPGASALVLVKGSVLGLLKETNKLVASLTLVLQQKAGDNLEHVFWQLNASKVFEEVTKLPSPLESESTISKKFQLSGQAITKGVVTPETGTEALLMA